MGKAIDEVMEGYKETEIGTLPEEWEVVRLGEFSDSGVLKLKNGFPCGNHNDQKIGIPHMRPLNVTSDGQVSLYAIKYIQTERDISDYLLQSGDVIFNNTNSEELVGKTAYWDKSGNYVLSNHMTIIRVIIPNIVETYFLARFLHMRWFEGYYLGVCRRHVNQASISLERLKQVLIPLPPLTEQHKIAHVLSTIQRAIELQDMVCARELKKSLMRHLFTYGPVPVDQIDRVPLKETEIGPVPEHWEVVRLEEAITQTQYGLSMRGESTGKYPILRMNNLSDGQVDINSLQHVNLDKNTYLRFRLNKDDILFNRTNSYELVGKTSIFNLNGDYVFASYIIRLITNDNKLVSVFLNYYLNMVSTQNRLKLLATRGVSQSNISATKLKSFLFPLPPLSEQRHIAHILTTLDQKIEAEEKRKSTLQSLFQTMLHLLMTGRVRVKDLEVNVDAIGR